MLVKSFLEYCKEQNTSHFHDHKFKEIREDVFNFYSQPFNPNMIGNIYIKPEVPEENPKEAFNGLIQNWDAKLEEWQKNEDCILFDGFKYDGERIMGGLKKNIGDSFKISTYNITFYYHGVSRLKLDETYMISELVHYRPYPTPTTLDDFICDCQRYGIKLSWNNKIIEKYFKK